MHDTLEALLLALLERAGEGQEDEDGHLDHNTQADLYSIAHHAARHGLAGLTQELRRPARYQRPRQGAGSFLAGLRGD